jgi:hypothetical protein
MTGRLAGPALLALALCALLPCPVGAQAEPEAPPQDDEGPPPGAVPSDEPLAEEGPSAAPSPEPRYVEPIPALPSPTARRAPEPEPSIEDLERRMQPTLDLPEFRARVGGGVGLQTSPADNVLGRVHEELEWQAPALEFVLVGLGAAQMFGPGGEIYQIGARVGGHAWFCEDPVVRCQGAITLQLGAVLGGLGANFDFSADADLRFLFDRRFELFVRGGFFSVSASSFLNLTGGVGLAF